jgi:hypothetical protein
VSLVLYFFVFYLSKLLVENNKKKLALTLVSLVMVFNANFNNISVVSWRSVLLVDETGENQ